MAQNYTIDMFAPTDQIEANMQNIEKNLECLRSMFSGLTAPANAVMGQTWFDLGTSVLKQYDGMMWVGLMHGDANQKVWIYRNDTMPGWVADTAVSDRVLAIRNLTAGQTYSIGGTEAGTWPVSGFFATQPSHTHSIAGVGTHRHRGGPGSIRYGISTQNNQYYTDYQGSHSHGGVTGATATTIPFSGDGTWRPAAAVGTLQHLDL